MFDNEEWLDLVKWFTCGPTTFREAHRKTGRTLCISLSTTTKSAPPILLNHVSAPHVVIASAVVASAAMPGLLKHARLLAKTADGNIETLKEEYWDGSIAQV
jgi:predicted acylesterase/phospholipase RssA